jgi:hypothetical protein
MQTVLAAMAEAVVTEAVAMEEAAAMGATVAEEVALQAVWA